METKLYTSRQYVLHQGLMIPYRELCAGNVNSHKPALQLLFYIIWKTNGGTDMLPCKNIQESHAVHRLRLEKICIIHQCIQLSTQFVVS